MKRFLSLILGLVMLCAALPGMVGCEFNKKDRNNDLFRDGVLMVRVGGYGYIDKTGNYVLSPRYGYIDDSTRHLGYGPVDDSYVIICGEWGRYGFFNIKTKEVIDPQFNEVGCFANGLAPVRLNDKWGYIDKGGKFVIKPQFEYASPFFDDGYAYVKNSEGKYGIINSKGELVISYQFDDVIW